MARVGANRSPLLHTLFIIPLFLILVPQINGHSLERKLERAPITAKGLSYDYYSESCPSLERIVRKYLEEAFAKDIAITGGFLHIFFHDCFTSGCDASILLHGRDGELSNTKNKAFSDELIYTIDNLHVFIYKQCQRIVSCSDIIILGAREAIYQLGGPYFDVPLGRRDSLTFNIYAPEIIPSSFDRTETLLKLFASKDFDATDVVALSGSHTIGLAHCGALVNRIIEDDPPIDPLLKSHLETRCQTNDHSVVLYLDMMTPYKFDNKYYVNLLNNQGVITSDQVLTGDSRTKDIVYNFASNQDLFFEKFASAFVKMSQLDLLTGDEGEIRNSCFITNNEMPSTTMIKEVVESIQKV